MPVFEPIARQSLADGVFEQIVEQIVVGELPDGGALPSERHLADAFGVSRPAVREALQRLAQSGMVAIRQGESTTVRPWRRTAGPDLLARLLLRPDGSVDLRVARSVLEVRQAVGPDIAARAAERHDDSPHLAELLGAPLQRLSCSDDAVVLQQAAMEFWDALVDASQNVAYRLMTNTLSAAYAPLLEGLAEVMRDEVSNVDGYRAVASAVLGGDAGAARGAAHTLLEAGTGAVLSAITNLLENQ
ncbi:MAG: GntR family transcriptional repressor for pyruvate dehydrogenase complex [Glaciecola sp.]